MTLSNHFNDLDDLLNQSLENLTTWESNIFDNVSTNKQLVLCGAGGLGKKIAEILKAKQKNSLIFTDTNPKKWDTKINDINVISPQEAIKKFSKNGLFIITVWGAHNIDTIPDRINFWRSSACKDVISCAPIFWKYHKELLPHFTRDLPSKILKNKDTIKQVARIWKDEKSLVEYIKQIAWRLSADDVVLKKESLELPYFPKDIVNISSNESFVDCGAYDGDTLMDFLKLKNDFVKFWALEPDPFNRLKLNEIVKRLPESSFQKIKILPYAVGKYREKRKFLADGAASSSFSEGGNIEVDVLTIDDLFLAENPTYIKMDIEGAEPEALQGGMEVILKYRPTLAISVYHLQDHIWTIPSLLYKQLENYNYYLRAHDNDGWDLVLYAIPIEKSL